MTSPTIMWFRRDLRLAAQPTMTDAQDGGTTCAVFVLDLGLWSGAGAARRTFLRATLIELDDALDGRLVVKIGDPVEVLPALARSIGATAVVCGWDWTPVALRRDQAVAAALERDGVSLRRVGSPYAVPPGTITTGADRPYRVFTPYHRKWQQLPVNVPSDADAHGVVVPAGVRSDPLPTDDADAALSVPPGRAGALATLRAFLDGPVEHYPDHRDDAAADATSRLSAALHFGCLHPSEILGRLDSSRPAQAAFARQIAWRDFYAQVVADRPDSAWADYRPEASVEVDGGPETAPAFAAWCQGRTGFPYVDAGMRQLLAEGWMHNRLRMVTASFLVKDLHLDWRRGARHFLRHLVDGDIANNNHGWQWVAGTGTDASPYHRIFNPTAQGRRFDPDGRYIRRWVPELAEIDGDDVHEPMGTLAAGATGYPPPIVDHATERQDALRRLEQAKQRRG